MGTKLNPGRYDCYANAEPDEPMFVLLARDKHAPALVWLWAALRELDQERPEMVAEARECMSAMIEYQSRRGRETCGLGVAVLAGVTEMIRSINWMVDQQQKGESVMNRMTPVELIRLLMSQVRIAEPTLPAEQRQEGT